jgi:hypothetical protein
MMKQLIFLLILSISTSSFAQSPAKDSSVLQDEFTMQNLIGKWKDQNSTTIFKKNGTYSTTFDNGIAEYGKWSVEKNILSLRGEIPYAYGVYFTAYNILSFSPTKFEYQLVDKQEDSTIWIAYKIEKKERKKSIQ